LENAPDGFIDYLLLNDLNRPIALVEAKRENIDPLNAKEQAREYARAQHIRHIFLSNGNIHYYWDLEYGEPTVISKFLSIGQLNKAIKWTPSPEKMDDLQIDENYIAISQDANWLTYTETQKNEARINKGIKQLRDYQIEAVNKLKNEYIKGKYRFPPIEIQQKIVSEIEQYQKVIDGCNLLIENYKPSFEIKEDWERVTLNDICTITSSKRIYQNEYVSEGIPFYRTKEIVELNNGNQISTELYIKRERYEKIKKEFDVPQKGEILLSAVGTIGVSWVISDDREFYFKDGNLVWLKNFNNVNPFFLKFTLDSIFKSNSIYAFGAAYNALTIVNLKQFKIYLPSLEEQNKIVEELLKEQSTINGAKELKSKMQQKIKGIIDSVWGK